MTPHDIAGCILGAFVVGMLAGVGVLGLLYGEPPRPWRRISKQAPRPWPDPSPLRRPASLAEWVIEPAPVGCACPLPVLECDPARCRRKG